MGAVWKGTQGPISVHEEAFYDAETQTYWKRFTYRGSATAISGLELTFQSQGVSYDITNDGPVFELETQIPFIDPDTQSVDRYEITTEAHEIDAYSNEDVFNEAYNWDLNRGSTQRTWRTQIEEYLDQGTAPDLDTNVYTTFLPLADHLRGGVTTFQRDYVVLRRFRRVDLAFGQGAGRINLKDSSLIYSTAQLQLPSNVAFVLPPTPIPTGRFATLLRWGWKLRGQAVDIIGSLVEQRYELSLAPHSLLDNVASTSNLAW